MTISTSTNKFRYEGNGVTDTFAFNGRIFNANDIVVEIITRSTDVLAETLTLTTDYSVTINSPESASVTVVSGKIPSVTQDIQLRRSLAQTQTLDLPTGTVFPAVSVENALDKNTAVTQDLSEQVDRAIKLPVTSSLSSIELPIAVASEVIGWNALGDNLTSYAQADFKGDTGDTGPQGPAGGGLADVVEDTTPQLGGDLDVNGNTIVSISDGDIEITPNGTGSVILDGISYPQADGTDGQVLTTDGSGNTTFEDAGGGGWVPIQTQTVSSAVASVDFTSGTYKVYVVVGSAITASTDNVFLRFLSSTDGGSSYDNSSDYSWKNYGGDSGSAGIGVAQDTLSDFGGIHEQKSLGNNTGENCSFILKLYDPSNGTDYKQISGEITLSNTDGFCAGGNFLIQRDAVADIDAIRLFFSSGNITSGTFTLYGLAGA